jgi:alpha,alpha-trehalase
MESLDSTIFFLLIFSVMSQSPDKLYEELFEDVQRSRIFPDSKTFCDVLPRHLTPTEILAKYQKEKLQPSFNLAAFVSDQFILPSTPPTVLNENLTITEHCHRLWPLLTRTITHNNYSSLIEVPHPFVVPGGRFREFYYWDTYFTMLGLVKSNETNLLNNMLENFAYLIRTIGHIPNGNRYYYAGRSQPPFFVLMTELLGQTEKYKNELEMEYQFWMTKRAVTLDDGTILNRHYDDLSTTPRPEAFLEDEETVHKRHDNELYAHLRAGAESGWDFSSRWMEDETDLSSTIATHILPVDLNCLLYHLELALGKTNEAERRRQAIQKYMWSSEYQFYTDYNFMKKKVTNQRTLAALFPLWLNVSTPEQTEHVARQIEPLFLRDGGLITTISKRSTQQWDNPNGWAPHQYIAYRTLLKIPGYEKLARTIRQRWMSLNERVYKETGKMMEKYDVVNINRPAGGGEYKTQDGFGWTNGVYLDMFYDQQTDEK